MATVLVVSLALHVVAVVIFGTIKIVADALREETVFEAAPIVPPPQKEPEYTVNLQQRNQSTPPPRPPAIVVNNPSELEIPALDIDVNVDSSSIYGRGGGGFGGGLAGIREMALTDFGYTGKTEGTLEATLVDLKRLRSGKPSGLTSYGARDGAIREFTKSTWDVSNLTRKFYTAKNNLYASYWMIANGPAARAPKAFGVQGEIEPSGIAALYQGTFRPDRTMQMRFCGMADDVLIVRLDNQIVLDGSWKKGYSNFDFNAGGPKIPSVPKSIRLGKWIELRASQTYDLSILVAEIPGGSFGCYLFYEVKGREGLQIFSTKPFTPAEERVIQKMHPAIADLL